MGEIKVAIIKAKAESTPKIYCNPVLVVPNAAIVHERVKMGLAHHVKYALSPRHCDRVTAMLSDLAHYRYGNVIPPAHNKAHRYFFKNELLGTIATFVFKYRPLGECLHDARPLHGFIRHGCSAAPG